MARAFWLWILVIGKTVSWKVGGDIFYQIQTLVYIIKLSLSLLPIRCYGFAGHLYRHVLPCSTLHFLYLFFFLSLSTILYFYSLPLVYALALLVLSLFSLSKKIIYSIPTLFHGKKKGNEIGMPRNKNYFWLGCCKSSTKQ